MFAQEDDDLIIRAFQLMDLDNDERLSKQEMLDAFITGS